MGSCYPSECGDYSNGRTTQTRAVVNMSERANMQAPLSDDVTDEPERRRQYTK
jgi:hypothetical protein